MNSMTISDFQNLLEDHNLNDLNDKLDSVLGECMPILVNKLFEERCE